MMITRYTHRAAASIVTAGLLAGVPAAVATASEEVGSPIDAQDEASTIDPTDPLAVYGGDPQREAELVAQEARRLIDVELVADGTLFPTLNTDLPYRVAGEPVSTLVLPARDAAYTERDLAALAPLTFLETAPGVYLLSENIVVMEGATLDLRRPGGMQIQMASQENGFTSIVVDGGNLVIQGTPTEPVRFQAWDAQRSQADTDTSDGRAYIRVMGGFASITDATFQDMGFWSGNTGGLALTGTELASTLGLGEGERELPEVYIAAPEGAQTVEEGDPLIVDGSAEGETAVPLTRGVGLYSNGVTAWLSGLTVTGNAYGLFVSDASSVELQNSTFTQSLVDGVVFHREVINSRITGVESSNNAGDGFRVTRGSHAVQIDTVTAANNGANGITVDGTPLSSGPSATGLSSAPSGDHSVLNSRFTNNARYGIAIVGGADMQVRRNTVTGSEFGIMVSDGATEVLVEENRVEAATKQGIAIRDDVAGQVWGNHVIGSEIGIYARASSVAIARNTVEEVTNHGITVVGPSSGSSVSQNLIDGEGSSPIDTVRATGVIVLDTNESPSWVYVNLTERVLRAITRPMTLLWSILAVLLLVTAFSGFRYRGSGFGNPYHDRTPLHELTRGMVDPATVPGVKVPVPVEASAEESSGRSRPGQSALPTRRPQHEPVRA